MFTINNLNYTSLVAEFSGLKHQVYVRNILIVVPSETCVVLEDTAIRVPHYEHESHSKVFTLTFIYNE